MIEKIKILFVLVIFLMGSNIYSQQLVPVLDEEALQSYNQVIIQQYPHMFDTMLVSQVYKVDNNHVQVEYLYDNVKYEELIYEKDGKMINVGTSMELPIESFPDVVLDSYSDEYGDNILGVYEYQSKYGDKLYVIENNNKRRFYYNELGVKAKPPL